MNPNQQDPREGVVLTHKDFTDYDRVAVDQAIEFTKAISAVKALSIEDFQKVLNIINKQYGRQELG